MKIGNRKSICWELQFSDSILFIISSILSFIIRAREIDVFIKYHPSTLVFIFLTVTLKIIFFFISGAYSGDKVGFALLMKRIIITNFVSSFFVSAVMLLLVEYSHLTAFPRSVLIIDPILVSFFLFVSRIFYLSFSEKERDFSDNDVFLAKTKKIIIYVFKNYSNAMMFLLILGYGVTYLLIGGVISISDGYGWDGQFYREITKNFGPEIFLSKTLNIYRVQRIIPSGLVSIGLQLLNIPINKISILLETVRISV